MNLQSRALKMSIGVFLSSEHNEKDLEAIVEGLTNSDERVLDELGVIVWEPFRNYPYAKLARLINEEAQTNFHHLLTVRSEADNS